MYEDYDRTERIAWGLEKAKNDDLLNHEKRIYILSQVKPGMPAVIPYQIGFRMLTTLLQTYSGDTEAVIRSLGDVKPEQEETLRHRCECAWYWVTECAPEEFRFALRLDGSSVQLSDIELKAVRQIRDTVLPVMNDSDEKILGQKVYDVATGLGMEPKSLFTTMYHVLVNKDQGPRLASFMKIIGKERLENILKNY